MAQNIDIIARKWMRICLYLSAAAALVGWAFTVQHWPYADDLMIISKYLSISFWVIAYAELQEILRREGVTRLFLIGSLVPIVLAVLWYQPVLFLIAQAAYLVFTYKRFYKKA